MSRGLHDAIVDTGRALVALAWTTLLFRVGGRRAVAGATRRAGARRAASPTPGDVPSAAPWRAQRAVHRARRIWPAEVRCLQTALALHYVLRARGVPSRVRLGVRREPGGLLAHAWVEAGAQVLDDARLVGTYAVLGPVAPERTAA